MSLFLCARPILPAAVSTRRALSRRAAGSEKREE
jgi:hypothetical protein